MNDNDPKGFDIVARLREALDELTVLCETLAESQRDELAAEARMLRDELAALIEEKLSRIF